MTYVDGFLVAVPTANRDRYRDQAEAAAALFHEHGATRLVEGWGETVPRGERNDLYGAVQARDDEAVLFSWIEFPDRTARAAAHEKMIADKRMEALGEMAFDGQRMVYGGFSLLNQAGARGPCGYIDGVVAPVPSDRKEAYRDFCRHTATQFIGAGASRVVDAWGDDVPAGKVTDFQRAVLLEEGETVALGWIEWPDKAAREAGWSRLKEGGALGEMPYDGRRMIFGGFTPLLDR